MKRFDVGYGDGMYEDEDGFYIESSEYDKLQKELETLKKTFFDFMQNIDNYNVEFPTIMYDEWNEVNKLLGRD